MTGHIDFINTDTRKSLLQMSLPMMAAMFLNLAYNMMDSIWVGNLLGETAMAALTSSTPIVLLLTAIGMGASNGLSILLSQKIGAGDKKQTDRLITTSFVSAVLFSAALTVVLELGLPAILSRMNTRPEIFSMAYDYLSVYLLGYLSTFLYLYFSALLRSYGNTSLQAISILLCTILDCILNPIFIHWIGFNGAAITTILSESISVLILLVYMVRKKMFSLHFSAIDFHLIPSLSKTALPSILQQSIPAVSTGFLTAMCSNFSVTAVAGYGITGKLETLPFYPAMALNMVLTAIIGQCVGAKRADRARDYLKSAVKYGVGIVAVLSLLLILFAKQLSGLFVNKPAVAELVSAYFLIVGAGYVFNTITNCLLGALNGMGKPAVGMLLMMFYYLAVRIPLAFILSKTPLGLNGVWLAVFISHIVSCFSAALYYLILKKKGQAETVSLPNSTGTAQ